MRAISLWQPWASLFVTGPKRYETRHWPTTYRGWLLIHAAQYRVRMHELTAELVALTHSRGFDRVPYGALLGAVYLDHCQHVDDILARHLTETDPDSLTCGNWARGRFAWRRAESVALLEPIHWRGQQGFFEVPEAELPREFVDRVLRTRP